MIRTVQKLSEMKFKKSILLRWENKFPCLDHPWTHWWIEGDECFIGVVPVDRLGAAVNLIKVNCIQFHSIKACRAKLEKDGGIVHDEKRMVEIFNAANQDYLDED